MLDCFAVNEITNREMGSTNRHFKPARFDNLPGYQYRFGPIKDLL